jgi:AraC-like DNA-binding protein
VKGVGPEQVRMWRPPDHDRVLLMAGRTCHYAVEPRGEYVFGVVGGAPMRSRRGRERRLVRPGELVAWDPSQAHSGTAVDDQPWVARLMVIETADLAALGGDEDTEFPEGLSFPDPVCPDPELTAEFLGLHAALDSPTTRLERDERLAVWSARLAARWSVRAPARRAPLGDRDDHALRLARDYLAEHADSNVGLDELAAAAGVGKFRLIRLFRHRTGLAPHALQLAHRIRTARRLLENGHPIATTATATGFADQSHLHRHFRRGLGITPRSTGGASAHRSRTCPPSRWTVAVR